MEQFAFSVDNFSSRRGIFCALEKIYPLPSPPVIVCVGTDKVIGDSVGAFVGTLLKRRRVNAYVYGTLDKPITAFEVPCLNGFLKRNHPDSKIIAIDSAVGLASEIGLIKVTDSGIKPGLGAGKNFDFVGDLSIIAVIAEKGKNADGLKNARLGDVYALAELIADALDDFISYSWETRKIKRRFCGITKIAENIG